MLLKFDTHPTLGYYEKEGKIITASAPSNGTILHKGQKPIIKSPSMILADASLGSNNMPNSSSANVDRYNPVRDRLDEGSVVEDWIPRDASGLDDMFRLMYHRDTIAGVVVDLLSDLIWSSYELTGITDNSIRKIYEDSINAIDVISIMPDITREFLVLGRSISSMIYDKDKGIIKDITSHDPSLVRLTPIPIKGYDPKIDLIPSPGLRAFVTSTDPRDVDARKALPEAFIKAVMTSSGSSSSGGFGSPMSQGSSGMSGIPLDPVTTLFTARRVFNYDMIGTSLFTRLISLWALEKALINSTVTSARRRSRAILHVKAGIDNIWEPTPSELDNIAGMFIQADEDPVGAVVVTRTGVDSSEVRSGADFYKWSDEWDMLTQGKMRALGVNEALLTGDATYSNQDAARMFFLEKADQLRSMLTKRVFSKRLFPLIARVHGFQKRTTAQIQHGVYVKADNEKYDYGNSSTKLTQRQSLEIPESQLIVPTMHWNKQLVNNVDDKRMELLDKAEEKGLPVSLRSWASAANIDLDAAVSDMANDAELRKKIAGWKKSFSAENIEDDAKLEFVKSLQNLAKANLQRVHGSVLESVGPLGTYLFWDEAGKIGPLSVADMAKVIDKVNPSSSAIYALTTQEGIRRFLYSELEMPIKVEAAHYLLYRTGLTTVKPSMSSDTVALLSDNIKSVLNRYSHCGDVYQLGQVATKELSLISRLLEVRQQNDQQLNLATERIEKAKKIDIKDKIPHTSPNLYGGKD